MTHHDTFDAAMRDAHAASLDQLSPRVRAQLAQRRRLALDARQAAHARPGMRWAVATLAVAAIAIGLLHQMPAPRTAPHSLASDASAASPADTLDETPDFYVWLASGDANSFASE